MLLRVNVLWSDHLFRLCCAAMRHNNCVGELVLGAIPTSHVSLDVIRLPDFLRSTVINDQRAVLHTNCTGEVIPGAIPTSHVSLDVIRLPDFLRSTVINDQRADHHCSV